MISQDILTLAGSLPAEPIADANGMDLQISGAGDGACYQSALRVALLPGYTGPYASFAIRANNWSQGSGTELNTNQGAVGIIGSATAVADGSNVGLLGQAFGGAKNAGGFFRSTHAKNDATNIGAVGMGFNAGVSGVRIGGYFYVGTDDPPWDRSAALIANNRASSDPIALFMHNDAAVFEVDQDGNLATTRTGADGLVIKNLKNSGNAMVSGTPRTVEININGTPYYILCYPISST